MTAQIIDGHAVAAKLLEDIAHDIEQFTLTHGRRPCLATVLVGDDPSSHTYVRMKRNRCAEVGMESRYVELPTDTTTADLVAEVQSLSADAAVDGILLQHPVPAHIDERAAFEAITPGKDVDGVTMHSFAAMAFSEKGFHSCTPGGSFASSTPTTYHSPGNARSSSAAARSSESLSACCCSREMRPSPTATLTPGTG